jgi:hypothetical protein
MRLLGLMSITFVLLTPNGSEDDGPRGLLLISGVCRMRARMLVVGLGLKWSHRFQKQHFFTIPLLEPISV